MPDGGDQVGQRLAGAGPGLDGQVLAGLDGVLHRLGHGDLAGPFRTADARHRRGEQFGHRGNVRWVRAAC